MKFDGAALRDYIDGQIALAIVKGAFDERIREVTDKRWDWAFGRLHGARSVADVVREELDRRGVRESALESLASHPLGSLSAAPLEHLIRSIDGEIRSIGKRLLAVEERLGIEPPVEDDDARDEREAEGDPAPLVRSPLPRPPDLDPRGGARGARRPHIPERDDPVVREVAARSAVGEMAPDAARVARSKVAQEYLAALREAKLILGAGAIAIASGAGESRRYCVADRVGDTKHSYVADSWEAALSLAREGVKVVPPYVPVPADEDLHPEVARKLAEALWGEHANASYSPADSTRSRCCVAPPVGTKGRRMAVEGSFVECFAALLDLDHEAVRLLAAEPEKAKASMEAAGKWPLAPRPAESKPVKVLDLSDAAARILARDRWGAGALVAASGGRACVSPGPGSRLFYGDTFLAAFVASGEFPTRSAAAQRAIDVCGAEVARLRAEQSALPIDHGNLRAGIQREIDAITVPTPADVAEGA